MIHNYIIMYRQGAAHDVQGGGNDFENSWPFGAKFLLRTVFRPQFFHS
jgi:hypothetical protein